MSRVAPILVVGAQPRITAGVRDLVDAGVIAVWPGSFEQLAAEVRRWRPRIVVAVAKPDLAVGLREVGFPVVELADPQASAADTAAAVRAAGTEPDPRMC
jgi:hypothetical protein